MDRYNTSKLLVMFVVRQLAAMAPLESSGVIPPHPLINPYHSDFLLNRNPSFCQSELSRELTLPGSSLIIKALARPSEVGVRTLVLGAACGPESHGQYLPDCKVTPIVGMMKGEKGAGLQRRVWEELRGKLEVVRPGVTTLGVVQIE
ncbi:hypothetical protein LCER1_G001902 [Lachnellula cervina]|uniref:Uncharacterized protein n=1 Tax=Lachnellula cervina TaxID=1316786 RepID=A0A7D8YTY2_9HELO|nr:hypothetical protein LCER1_G001902 [Lachnellula cervina]